VDFIFINFYSLIILFFQDHRSSKRKFNQQQQSFLHRDLNNNTYNNQKKINNYSKIKNKAETNQSYLLTNPNLLNTQVNSMINLNVMNGTRYFIIKSVDEDNVHKVNFCFI